MYKERNNEYKQMYEMYLKYEREYLRWAELRKEFKEKGKNRFYYKRNNANKRREYANRVVNDFCDLEISLRDLHGQIGGCREIVQGYNLTKFTDEPFWRNAKEYHSFDLYQRLKLYPDEIYNAIEDTYEYSKQLSIPTTALVRAVLEVIEFIATECVKINSDHNEID